MHFAHPDRLLLLLLVPAAAALLWASAWQARKSLERFGAPDLLARAGMAVARGRRALRSVFLLTGLAFLIVALAGPQWGATREKIERKGVDVVVVLDTSLSMDARDVAPSRLLKAKESIIRLVDMMKGDRLGIVLFSGKAMVMCPLTLDYNAARMFLDIIDSGIVPEPGTDIGEALQTASELFTGETEKYKVIVLISDGENLESDDSGEPLEVARKLAEKGIRIYTVGVGESEGSRIPLESGKGFKEDERGREVITRLDEETLRKIALEGEGEYVRLNSRSRGNELARIYSGIAGMDKKTFEEKYQINYEDRFYWFIGAALFFLVLEMLLPERKASSRRRRRRK
ncbi:MAG: VWA domain-containing protein [bacterium]